MVIFCVLLTSLAVRGLASANTCNRFLFVEYCDTHKLIAANTFFEYPHECIVSYHNLESQPMDIISIGKFAQIDYVLCDQQNADIVYDC